MLSKGEAEKAIQSHANNASTSMSVPTHVYLHKIKPCSAYKYRQLNNSRILPDPQGYNYSKGTWNTYTCGSLYMSTLVPGTQYCFSVSVLSL